MKKITSLLSRPLKFFIGILIVAVLFSACKKNDNSDYINNSPAAGLMAFNLSPDKPAIGFSLSGNSLANAVLNYTGYTGGYLPVYLGNREVRSFDYNTGSTLAITNNEFRDSMYYSAFLLGVNGNYRNVIVNDRLDTLAAATGKAWVRYINAIPDSTNAPAVTVGGDSPLSTPYATISSFRQVNAGAVNITVNNGSDISTTRTITMEENKIYTLLFVGLPNATDSTKSVQIKYIQNGTVSL